MQREAEICDTIYSIFESNNSRIFFAVTGNSDESGKMKLLHYFNWHWNVRFENWIISFSIKVLELRPFEFFNIFPPFDWIMFFLKHIRDISFDNRTFLNLGIQILFPLNVTTVVSFPWLLIKRIRNIFGIVSMHHIDLFC